MKTLLVYSTKHGTAARCAELLEQKMIGDVTRANAKDSPDPEGYDAVVLGASVYAGSIQREMKQYCERHMDALKAKRLGLFICSGDHGEKAREYLKLFGEELYAQACARELFGHEIHWETMNLIEKLLVRLLMKTRGSSSHLEKGAIDSFAEKMGV